MLSGEGFLMRKEQIAIIALAAWLTFISVLMLPAQSVDLELFFILSLLGMLVIVYLIEPDFVRPVYLQYFRYVLAGGIVIFIGIAAQKIMNILAWEIVFT